MVLAKPGSITPHTNFEAQVYVLAKDEGGRHTPFFTGYRPQFYVRTTDVTGKVTAFTADDGSKSDIVMPGDRILIVVQLIQPIAIEKGMRFAIREGGRTVGAGVVSNILKLFILIFKNCHGFLPDNERNSAKPTKKRFASFELGRHSLCRCSNSRRKQTACSNLSRSFDSSASIY
jgi:hypothetical protein